MFECAGKIAEIDRQMQDMYQRIKASDAYKDVYKRQIEHVVRAGGADGKISAMSERTCTFSSAGRAPDS